MNKEVLKLAKTTDGLLLKYVRKDTPKQVTLSQVKLSNPVRFDVHFVFLSGLMSILSSGSMSPFVKAGQDTCRGHLC